MMKPKNDYDPIAARELSSLLSALGIESKGLDTVESDEARAALSAVADMVEDAREAGVIGDEVSAIDPEAKPDSGMCGILRQLATNKKLVRYLTGAAPMGAQKMEDAPVKAAPEMSDSDIDSLLMSRMK